MNKLLEYSWQIGAAAVLMAGLFLSKGGLAPLMSAGRFLIPLVVAYIIYRLVRSKVQKALGGAMKGKLQQMMEAAMQQQQQNAGAAAGGRGGANMRRGPAAGQDKVIDLCPKCGSYLAPGHRCKN